jgi:hypothetical protein
MNNNSQRKSLNNVATARYTISIKFHNIIIDINICIIIIICVPTTVRTHVLRCT